MSGKDMKKLLFTISLTITMISAFAMNTFALAPVATGATKLPPWIIVVFVAAVLVVMLALIPKFKKK